MKLSDIEDLARSHLVEGETMTEQPSIYNAIRRALNDAREEWS